MTELATAMAYRVASAEGRLFARPARKALARARPLATAKAMDKVRRQGGTRP